MRYLEFLAAWCAGPGVGDLMALGPAGCGRLTRRRRQNGRQAPAFWEGA